MNKNNNKETKDIVLKMLVIKDFLKTIVQKYLIN